MKSKSKTVSTEIAATINTLHAQLHAAYGYDFSYTVAANGNVVAASDNRHGYIAPVATPAVGFVISTPHGDRYKVSATGEIFGGPNNVQPSGGWILRGLRAVNSGEFIPFDRLAKWLDTSPTLRYKNGNPRYTVADIDHGTAREWGNTKYHGVANIFAVDVATFVE